MRSATSLLMASAISQLVVGGTCLPAWAEDAAGVRWPIPGRRAEIRQPFRGSDIVVGTSSRTAGAIDTVTWAGHAFVNAYDHGRELQSAASFDDYGECLNPTEAGSAQDGERGTSSSRLDELRIGQDWLETRSEMAFWLAPGETSGGCAKGPGPYTRLRSDYRLAKRVSIGGLGVANAIAYRATFSVPRPQASATYEVATAYMPPDFARFWTYDPMRRTSSPLSEGPGEQSLPVILATEDGSHAMGVYSPDLPQASFPSQGYGRWSFANLPGKGNATVKWNCVFREKNLSPGDHTFTCYVLIGTLEDVRAGMSSLQAALTKRQTDDTGRQRTRDASLSQDASLPPNDHGRPHSDRGVELFVGTEPNCNSGVVTTVARYRDCATAPIGTTALIRPSGNSPPLYVSTAAGSSAGVVTNNPHHLDGPTKPIGFLLPVGSGGVPLFIGTQAGCNASVASTNPTHLNCSSMPLGATLR